MDGTVALMDGLMDGIYGWYLFYGWYLCVDGWFLYMDGTYFVLMDGIDRWY